MPLTQVQPQMAAGGPAFGAYLSITNAISSGVATLITFDAEEFDTASCYNNTNATVNGIPAYSFKPNVAGYYLFSANLDLYGNSNTTSKAHGSFFKNGSSYKAFGGPYSGDSVTEFLVSGSAIIYLNGSTDYVGVYGYLTATTPLVGTGQSWSWVQGSLLRAA